MQIRSHRWKFTVAVAAIAVVGALVTPNAFASDRSFVSGPDVYQPGTRPLGRPYSEWNKTVFRTNLEGPDPAVLHPDDCSAWPQPVPNVFAILNGPPGSTLHATCTIPRGDNVLVLPAGFVDWEPPGSHVAQTLVPKFPLLRLQYRDLQVRVDGRSVPLVGRFYVENRVPFPMTVSAPDLAPTCGPCETVGFGTPVMLKPLSAGHHVLVLHDQVLRTGDDGLTPVRDDHGRLIWDPATLTVDVTVA